jgi:hypothetical protein
LIGARRFFAPVAVLVAVLVLAACGGGSNTTARSTRKVSTDRGDSPYCDTLMKWGAYDWFKPGGEGFPGEPGKPLAGQPGAIAANKAYHQKYMQFADQARRLAPPEIRDAWNVYYAMGTGPFTAILERSGYDLTDPKFLAVFENPPESIIPGMEAFEQQIQPYENRVCGSGQPQPADVKFSGKANSEFCGTQKELDEGFQALVLRGTRPAEVKAYLTSPAHEATLERLDRAAPPEIRADVIATSAFNRQKQIPLVAKYGYDIPKLVANGSSLERHVLNAASPDIADNTARVEAYAEQVCGANG